jgi:hypothetical protein
VYGEYRPQIASHDAARTPPTDCHPWLVDDLCAHYARSGFLVLRVVGSMIEVRRPNARDEHEERRMIEMHQRIWEVCNPGAVVTPVL